MGTDSKTVGEYLSKKRKDIGVTLETVERETRIKTKYLSFLENNLFDNFHSHVQAKGFLRNYAKFLGLNEDMLLALYRRDFENRDMKRKIQVTENEPVEFEIPKFKLPKFTVKRKHAVIGLSVLFLFLSATFIYYNIRRTFEKPELLITSPFEINAPYDGRIAYEGDEITLNGKVSRGSSITINGDSVSLSPNYSFESNAIPVTQDETIIFLETENTFGSKNRVEITLYKPDNDIKTIEAVLIPQSNVEQLMIKADGILRYEDFAAGSIPIEITAERILEVTSTQLSEISISINGRIYTLDQDRVTFENTGNQIIHR
jgi:hypothetical protein